MSEATSTDRPTEGDRTSHVWYHLAIGSVAGAAVIGFAMLPPEIVGVVSFVGVLLVVAIDLIARRLTPASLRPRLRGGAIPYLVVLVVVTAGSLIGAATVVHGDDMMWLAWVLAGVVFLVALLGAWALHGRPAQTAGAPS
ncbi:hypothetical protein [Agromyces sp. NPDC056965]|uniref:hypothetical protein n=1 Tax=Agromyces sp. NPDC056965 TaxID=3345983 RepID=UPI0036396A70